MFDVYERFGNLVTEVSACLDIMDDDTMDCPALIAALTELYADTQRDYDAVLNSDDEVLALHRYGILLVRLMELSEAAVAALKLELAVVQRKT